MANKKEAELQDEMTTDEVDQGVPRVYEFGFHLDPELPSEEVKKAYQAFRSAIAERGEVVAEGEPHKIQLAYTISRQEPAGRRDFDSAFFCWIVYETTKDMHDEILALAKDDSRLVRFIDLITTKEQGRHSAELREIMMKTETEEKAEDEEVSDAELDAALEGAAV